jgi:plasmid stabilization system protein ParE
MVKIIWTQRSLTDLKSIAEYISKDSLRYASLTIERIINVTLLLETNPRIGRMVPEVGKVDTIREINPVLWIIFLKALLIHPYLKFVYFLSAYRKSFSNQSHHVLFSQSSFYHISRYIKSFANHLRSHDEYFIII